MTRSYISHVSTDHATPCQRCIDGLEGKREAQYRVVSDIIDLLVCRDCAEEAQRLGLMTKLIRVKVSRQSL